MIPRYLSDKGLKKVDFKIAFGDEFIGVMKTLKALGMTSTKPVEVAPGVFICKLFYPSPLLGDFISC